jgi:hypothetical protein
MISNSTSGQSLKPGSSGLTDGRLAGVLAQPELLLIPLAFVFHFTWEMLQDPLYAGLATQPHGDVRAQCLMATAGDVAITLTAFYLASLIARSRFWFLNAHRTPTIVWFAIGLLLTIALELYATRVIGRWSYGPLMPIVPILRIGLVPLLQWLLIPAALLFLMNRHFRGMRPFERDIQ